MGKKTTKATRKFASSGQLKKTIQARHKHQQTRKRLQGRRGAKVAKNEASDRESEEEENEQPVEKKANKRSDSRIC
jgi:nucleolar complex protein 2